MTPRTASTGTFSQGFHSQSFHHLGHNHLNAAKPWSSSSSYPSKDGQEALCTGPMQLRVRGCHWEVVDPKGKQSRRPSPEAYVAFTLELETRAGTKVITTRWSAVQTLDNDLLRPKMRFPHAPGYTKSMGNILARGTHLTFCKGSCLKPKIAQARLNIIADYLQAVLHEPELRSNVHVEYFLQQAGLGALPFGTVKSTHDKTRNGDIYLEPATAKDEEKPNVMIASLVTASNIDNKICEETSPQVSTLANVATIDVHAHPSDKASPNTKAEQEMSMFQALLRFSATHDVRTWLTTQATTTTIVPFAIGLTGRNLPARSCLKKQKNVPVSENNVKRAIKVLLFDSRLLGPYLYGQELGYLEMACKEWSGAAQQVTALTPVAAGRPCSGWQGLFHRKIKGLYQSFHGVTPRHPLSATSLRKHAKDHDREQAQWNSFIKALQENKMPKLQQLDFTVKFQDKFWRTRLTSSSISLMAVSFRNLPHLMDISLRRNDIGTQGALALANGLCHTPHLRMLDLSCNHIGDEGAIAIASVFEKVPKLEVLSIFDCGIEYVGSTFLADKLKYISELRFLGFTMPFFGNGPIIDQLHVLPKLRCLQIGSGAFHDMEAAMLAEKLPALPKLRCLAIYRGMILGPNAMAPIAEEVGNHPGLRRLCVSYNCDRETFKQWEVACARRGMVQDKKSSKIASMLHRLGKRGQQIMKIFTGDFDQELIFVHPTVEGSMPREPMIRDKYHHYVEKWSDDYLERRSKEIE